MGSGADPDRFTLTVAGLTDTGRTRKENQDTFLVIGLVAEEGAGADDALPGCVLSPVDVAGAEDEGERRVAPGRGGMLFLVADGMGGAQGGATASRMAVTAAAESVQDRWASQGVPVRAGELVDAFREAVESANRLVHDRARQDPGLQGMGTTFTGALVAGELGIIAQIGDSRAYRLRGGVLEQLTRDQSMVQEMIDAGALTPEEALRSPQRNVILQALGTSLGVDVVCSEVELREGDRFLLCSDGLSGVVSDEAMTRTLERAPGLGAACRALVDAANAGGGPDNITILLFRVDPRDGTSKRGGDEAPADTRPFRVPPAGG